MTAIIDEIKDNPSRMQSLSERDFQIAWQQLVDLSQVLDDLERQFLKEYTRRAVLRESKGKRE